MATNLQRWTSFCTAGLNATPTAAQMKFIAEAVVNRQGRLDEYNRLPDNESKAGMVLSMVYDPIRQVGREYQRFLNNTTADQSADAAFPIV